MKVSETLRDDVDEFPAVRSILAVHGVKTQIFLRNGARTCQKRTWK